MKQFHILIVLLLSSLFLGYGTLGLYQILSESISSSGALFLNYFGGIISFATFITISIQLSILTKRYKAEIGLQNFWVLLFLALFLFLCGVGHLIDTVFLAHDAIQALGKVATALTTLITAILFWPLSITGLTFFYTLKKERDFYEHDSYRWTSLPGTLMATQKLQDPNGSYLWVNKEWESILGWTKEEMTSKPWHTFVHPSDLPVSSSDSKIQHPFTSMSGYLIRYRHKKNNADGTPRWVWTKWDATTSPNTGLVYGSARDVTDQVSASEEAGITKTHLDNWLTVFPDLLVTVTIDNSPLENRKYLWVSPSCKDILGWTEEELKGMPIISLVHPEDFDSALKEYKKYEATDLVSKITFSQRVRHKNGDWRWIEWSGVSDHNMKISYSVGRDVTEMFNRQISLEISEARFKAVMHNAPIGLALVDLKGKWLDINASLCDMVGHSKEELLSKTLTEMTHPEDVSIDKELVQDLLSHKITNYRVEKRCTHKKGHAIKTDINVSLVWNGNTPQYFILQVRDLTEEVSKQQEIERHIKDLEQFASVAAHQLKSPPRTIYGMAQAILEDYGEILGEEGRSFLEDIKQDAEDMSEVVDGLYRFSKVRTSNDIEKESVNLNSIVSAIQTIRKDQGKLGTIIVQSPLPIIHTNKILLQEVFYNIIDNGLKFNKSSNPTVQISFEDREYSVVISISDNGIGIPKAYTHKIFKMFERLHPTYPGTGVGLSVAASIVQKLGGKIDVESDIEIGSVFILLFPK